jgi:hypothetical protein
VKREVLYALYPNSINEAAGLNAKKCSAHPFFASTHYIAFCQGHLFTLNSDVPGTTTVILSQNFLKATNYNLN